MIFRSQKKEMMQQTNETKSHHETNESQLAIVPSQFHKIPHCTLCDDEMEFVEGDVIFGGSWYHANCWKLNSNGGKQNV